MMEFAGPLPAGNYMVGRSGHTMQFDAPQHPAYLVIHTIGGRITAADDQFKDPGSQASTHYGVGLDGSLIQWVSESDTAYHAGNWEVDLSSIGLHHEDDGHDGPRTDALYSASSSLVREICLRYGIPISRQWIVKHQDVAGSGTTCPDALDVDRIVAMASGIWRGPPPAAPTAEVPVATPVQPAARPRPPDQPQAPVAEPAAPTPVILEASFAPPPSLEPIAPAAPAAPPVAIASSPPAAALPAMSGDPMRDIAAVLYGDPGRSHDIYNSIKGVVDNAPVLIQLEKMLTSGLAGTPSVEPVSNGEPPPQSSGPPAASTPEAPPAAAATGGVPAGVAPPHPGPALADQKMWGGSAAAIFAIQIVYLTILASLAIIFFTDRSLIDLPNSIGPISVAIPWFGALGAVLISLVGVTQHRQDWDPSYRFWHWARPLLGASFGSISVLIFQAGILAVGTTPQTGSPSGGAIPKDLLYYLVAFVVGYREETFRELIKRLADVIFTPGSTGGTALSVNSMLPQSGPASGGTTVTVLGTGLSATDAVRFGVSQAAFHVDGDSQITITSPAGTAGATAVVTVVAKTAAASAGSFTYS